MRSNGGGCSICNIFVYICRATANTNLNWYDWKTSTHCILSTCSRNGVVGVP